MTELVHATCVSWNAKAALITGKSGRGKSALGLQLLALGCDLVADDRTQLTAQDGQLVATCPASITGLIEARGVGILCADHVPQATVTLCVDLDQVEVDRLPPRRMITRLGCDIPLIWRVDCAHFDAAILQILKSGWSNR